MYRNIMGGLQRAGKGGIFNKDAGFVRRWPINPKVAFFGPPNVFLDEITMRYVPISAQKTLMSNIYIRKKL